MYVTSVHGVSMNMDEYAYARALEDVVEEVFFIRYDQVVKR